YVCQANSPDGTIRNRPRALQPRPKLSATAHRRLRHHAIRGEGARDIEEARATGDETNAMNARSFIIILILIAATAAPTFAAEPVDEKIDWIRMQKPLDAVHNLKKNYNIDEKRIYVAGFSAGGEIASTILAAWSDVFRGGVFMNAGGFHFGAADETGRYISG